MRARGLTFFLFVCGSTACGLAVTGSNAPDDGGGPSAGEGGVTTPPGDAPNTQRDGAPDVVDGAVPDDAPSDAPADAPVPPGDGGDGCTVLLEDTFTTQSLSWDALGSAGFGPGQVELTPGSQGVRAGAIWWKVPLTFAGTLRAEVELAIDSNGTLPGHGIAIGWIAATSAYVIGQSGQSFGLCNGGLVGVAVAVDERDDQLLAMDAMGAECSTNGGAWPAVVGSSGTLVMEMKADSLTARFGTTSGTRAVTASKTGYFGITAATGGPNQSEHVITSVRVTSCP